MIATQERMFARRGKPQRPCDQQLIRDMYELTAPRAAVGRRASFALTARRMERGRQMSLPEVYAPGKFGLSFELFPPKTPEGFASLFRHARRLMEFHPDFMTCTYGAGGSTRDKTLDVVGRLKREFRIPAASHLTCVGATVRQLREYLTAAQQIEADAIVAVRGDPPRGESAFRPVEGGLRHASELVALIRAEFPRLGVAVAGYPETHREAPSPEADLQHLKHKVEAGADIVITQLFYNNDDFFRFRDRCAAIGLRAPLVPGILPVTNLAQVRRVASLCGAKLHDGFLARLGESDERDWQFQVGVEYAVHQVQSLVDNDAPGVHFYVLNKSEAAAAVLRAVRLPAGRG